MTSVGPPAPGTASEGAMAAREAFQHLAPIAEAYATLPITDGFNWRDCLAHIGAGRWYLVVFRSERRSTADNVKLIAHDDRAYAAAQDLPGFLFYFRGEMNERRECVSFCLWENQDQARTANHTATHQVAIGLVDEMYVWYTLERYVVTKHAGSDEIEFQAASPCTK